MNLSFYTGAVGAGGCQARMDVIGNNLANMSTTGYKAKRASFADLIYSNIMEPAGQDTKLKQGSGSRLIKADTNFNPSALQITGREYDYAILGDGFFALYNPETEEISYTRDGSFRLSLQQDGSFYLTSGNGKWVMDPDSNPIVIGQPQTEDEEADLFEEAVPIDREIHVGVFDFDMKFGMENIGNNEYIPTAKNGQPIVRLDQALIEQGALEEANVDMADEFTQIIRTQRAFQAALRMVQTSDEIETTINGLRA